MLETKDQNLNRKSHQHGRDPCNCEIKCMRNGVIVWYPGEIPGPNAAPHHRETVTIEEENALDTIEGREKMEREELRQAAALQKHDLGIECTGDMDDETSLFIPEEAVEALPAEDPIPSLPPMHDAPTATKRKAGPKPRPSPFIPSTARRMKIANPSPDSQTRIGFTSRSNGPTAELPPLMKQGVTGIVGRGTRGEIRAVHNMVPIDGTPYFEAEAAQNPAKRSRGPGKFTAEEYGGHLGTMATGALDTSKPQKLRMKRTRCRECFKQDVKCDHMLPCERCNRRNIPCSYDPARLIKDDFTPLPRLFHTPS
jgi:hypothetical protein